MFEKYFTEQQINQLAERREHISDDVINSAQQEWQTIFADLKKLSAAGKSASSPEVQVLAKRSLELIDQFTGGDPGLRQSLQKMYDTEGGDRLLSQGGMDVDKALYDFFAEALEIGKKK